MQRILPLIFVLPILSLGVPTAGCAGTADDRGPAPRDIAENGAETGGSGDEAATKKAPVVSPLAKFRQKDVAFAGGEFACVSDADATKLESELKLQKVPQKPLRIKVMQGPKEALLCQAIEPHAALIAPLYRRIERAARWKTAPYSVDSFAQLAAEIRTQSPSATLDLPRVIIFGETDLRSAVPSR